MAVTQRWSEREVAQAPLVWRSTLRGVLVLDDDQVHQLEGLAAAVWLVLDDGPCTGAAVLEQLRAWHSEIDPDEAEQALRALVEIGLVRR